MFSQILQLDWTFLKSMCVSWGSETNQTAPATRNVTGVSALMCFRQVRAAGQKYLSSEKLEGWREGMGTSNRRERSSQKVVKM